MKCMFVINSNVSGGAERVVSILCNYFASRRIETVLVNFDYNSSFYTINDDVKVIKLWNKSSFNQKNSKVIKAIKLSKLLWNEIKMENPDIIIPILFDAEFLTLPYCVIHRIPCITSVRNDPDKYKIYHRLFRRAFYPFISGVVVQSEIVRKHRDFAKLRNCTIIPNPIVFKEIDKKEVDKNKIISVGRLTEQKNHEMAIRAIGKLVDEFPDIHFHIFGDGELHQNLDVLIRSLGLENHVFLEGVVEDAIIKNSDANVFVMASDYEGFPNVLVEAMMMKIPVICTDFNSGTARELLDNGNNGWLIPVGGEDELVNAIKESLVFEKKCYTKMHNGYERCKMYDIEKIGKKWIDFIYEVIYQ